MAGVLDPQALAALEGAVEAAPRSVPLRLTLVRALLDAAQGEAALRHCAVLLGEAPDDTEVLGAAVEAAAMVGDEERAVRYRRALRALVGRPLTVAPPGTAGAPPAVGRMDPDPALDSRGDGAGPAATGAEPGAGVPLPIPLTLIDGDRAGDPEDGDDLVERPGVTLADVGGMEQVKRRLTVAFLAPMRTPALRQAFNKSLRGGLLLYGPPGCGKTFIARATAGELSARFMAVGVNDVLDMYMGRSEQNLHAIFATARRTAPCVLFFDELDALGQKRALTRHHPAARSLAAQFLTELDGVGTENQGVFILGATNHPWDVDGALRRPGRFDRVLLVLPPDQPAREAILAYHLRDRPVAPGVVVGAVARRTDGFSGADLAHLVESAAERALMDSMELGEVRPIDEGDIAHALAEVRPSVRGWFQQARQHALFANEGGMYDDLLDYIRANRLG